MLQLWWTCTVELKVSAVVFWQAVLSQNVRSYVWVLMTCLNHSLPPSTHHYASRKKSIHENTPVAPAPQRSSNPIDLLPYIWTAGKCDGSGERRGSPTWSPAYTLIMTFWPLALSGLCPISHYDSVYVRLAPLETRGGDPEQAHPPTLPSESPFPLLSM